MKYRFRVVEAKRRIIDDGGFVSQRKVHCVVNQNDDVYAVYWTDIQALNYRDKLASTMRPPAMGGRIENGIYLR
jgi:hypothetical protein